MKYILFILLFFLCLSCSHRPVQEVDTVSYRGWENCLKLSNRVVSVIVNPTYGGQILYFGLESHGDNILWSDSVINGWTVENYIRTSWAGPYQTFIEEDKLRLVSHPSQAMGIQVERIYFLEENQPVLHIKQRMSNISNGEVEYCFWTRTLLPAGGIYYCEAIPSSQYPLGFSEISLSADTLIPSYHSQERIHVENHYFTAFPGGYEQKKYGINTTNGMYFYQFSDYLYIKQNKYVPQGKYDNNLQVCFPNMIYFNDEFLEMEPNSPMVKLKPGEAYEYEEIWTLREVNSITDNTY